MKEESKNAHQEGELEGGESTGPLNSGHPQYVRTILKVPSVLPFTSILQQPLNSGHPATPYIGQFSRS